MHAALGRAHADPDEAEGKPDDAQREKRADLLRILRAAQAQKRDDEVDKTAYGEPDAHADSRDRRIHGGAVPPIDDGAGQTGHL